MSFKKNIALLFIGFFPLSAAYAFDTQELLQQLGQNKQGQAKFVETKTMAMLDRPIKSSGTLAFQAPAYMEKITLEPTQESLVLNGDTLTVVREGKKNVVKLKSYPQVLAFIEAIRGVLLGDIHLLENGYVIQLTGTRENWSMALTPRDKKLEEHIKQIKFGGGKGQLQTIEYLQSDGDSAVMKIETLSSSPQSAEKH